jgi:hypothetical protein
MNKIFIPNILKKIMLIYFLFPLIFLVTIRRFALEGGLKRKSKVEVWWLEDVISILIDPT